MPRSTSLYVAAALSLVGAAAAGASWAAAVPAAENSATATPIKLERRMGRKLIPAHAFVASRLAPGLLEEERVRHHHHAAALGLGEHPGADAAGDAHVQLGVADGGLSHRRG